MLVKFFSYNLGMYCIWVQCMFDVVCDHQFDEVFYSEEVQVYFYYLLCGDLIDFDKVDLIFEVLKEDFDKYGQTNLGIIMCIGVLVNGNTCCVVLCEFNQEVICVGVLLLDVGYDDIDVVEFILQLCCEYKCDYMFVNELLVIDECVKAGWNVNQIVKEFWVKKMMVDCSQWILVFIWEVIDCSQVKLENGEIVVMCFIDFEMYQGKLEEFYCCYIVFKDMVFDEVDVMCEVCFIVIVLNKLKIDV